MPDFDIIGSNPGLYGTLGSAPSSGFDIIAPNAGGRPMPAPGQNAAAPNGGQPGGQPAMQPQGAPVSGLMAGILGLPTYGGAVPGASYLAPGQTQPNSGQPLSPQQAQQLLQTLQANGTLPTGNPAGAAQPQNNIGTAIGAGARSLFDGVVGLAR